MHLSRICNTRSAISATSLFSPDIMPYELVSSLSSIYGLRMAQRLQGGNMCTDFQVVEVLKIRQQALPAAVVPAPPWWMTEEQRGNSQECGTSPMIHTFSESGMSTPSLAQPLDSKSRLPASWKASKIIFVVGFGSCMIMLPNPTTFLNAICRMLISSNIDIEADILISSSGALATHFSICYNRPPLQGISLSKTQQ